VKELFIHLNSFGMKDFDFENLEVWNKAVDFAGKVIESIEKISFHNRLCQQIEAAAASVAQNIAEGKGRNSKKEMIQFLYYSRGSLYETSTLLEIFQRRNWISKDEFISLKKDAIELGKMLNSFIRYQKSLTN